MKNVFIKTVDKIISGTLKMNINSTTSLAIFQPKVPKELSNLSKIK